MLWHFNELLYVWARTDCTQDARLLTPLRRASTEVNESSLKADKLKARSHGHSEAQVDPRKSPDLIYLRLHTDEPQVANHFVYTLGEVALEHLDEEKIANNSVVAAVGLLLCYRLLQAMESAPLLLLHVPRASCCVQDCTLQSE